MMLNQDQWVQVDFILDNGIIIEAKGTLYSIECKNQDKKQHIFRIFCSSNREQ